MDIKYLCSFFWCAAVCQFIFGIFCRGLIALHSPSNWYEQEAYISILGSLWSQLLWEVVAILIAWQINAKLLITWRTLLKGKYFWLRSIGSSGIAELLFSLFLCPSLIFFGSATGVKEALIMLAWSWIFRIIITASLAFPSSFAVKMIKIIEQASLEQNYNPFA